MPVSKTSNNINIANALSDDLVCEVVPYAYKNMRISKQSELSDSANVNEIRELEMLIDDSVNSINTSYLNIAYALFVIYSKDLSFCYEFKMADYKGIERDCYSLKNNQDVQFNSYVRERFGLSKTTASNLLGIARNFLKKVPGNEYQRLPELKEACKEYSFSQLCELLPFFIENNVLVSESKIYKFLPPDMTIIAMREKKKNFVYNAGKFVEKLKVSALDTTQATDEYLDSQESILDEIGNEEVPEDDNSGCVSDDIRIHNFKNDIAREEFVRDYLSWPVCGKNKLLDLTYRVLYFSNGDKLIAVEYPQELVKYYWQYKGSYISFLESHLVQITDYIRKNKLSASYVNIFVD